MFVIFFSGQHSQDRIFRICASYSARIYVHSEDGQERERENQKQQIEDRLKQAQQAIDSAEQQKRDKLKEVQIHLLSWFRFVTREKAIYHALNLFDSDEFARCLMGEGWVPESKVDAVKGALTRASTEQSTSTVPAAANVIQPLTKKQREKRRREFSTEEGSNFIILVFFFFFRRCLFLTRFRLRSHNKTDVYSIDQVHGGCAGNG